MNKDGARDRFTGTYRLDHSGYVWKRKLLFRHPVPVNTFKNDPFNPLTFHTAEGDTIQPFRTFDGYDQGSVPLILQGVVSTNFGQKTTINHDSCFEFHAWWRNGTMERVTMIRANNMLYRMARAEFADACPDPKRWTGKVARAWDSLGSRITNGLAWSGVMLGGWFVWHKDPITLENARRAANVENVLVAEETGETAEEE